MIEFKLNGKVVKATQGKMLIDAAEASGVYIPRFCYHKKLSIVASCRMCLVKVEGSNKLVPACATPVTSGMVVETESEDVKEAQRAIMEFLLINHPLDCPICDQGGECELQDIALSYGHDQSQFNEGKRAVKDKSLGSLIATEMTRCIHCTRCVRFGEQVAGLSELGALGRGETTTIETHVEKALSSELSGNMIDLCPVGALTDKTYRFKVRSWEIKAYPSISPHDCVGSNLELHTHFLNKEKGSQVIRVVPREEESINESWIADRDRFSYEGLYTQDRLLTPKLKIEGEWREVSWQIALKTVVKRVIDLIKINGVRSVGGVISSNATTEECYLFQKVLRQLGVVHIDHRLHQVDYRDQRLAPDSPYLGCRLAELESQQVIILIGSRVQHAQPLIANRIRKAALKGARVILLNPINTLHHFSVTYSGVFGFSGLIEILTSVAKILLEQAKPEKIPEGAQAWLASAEINQEAKVIASLIKEAQGKGVLLLGDLLWPYADASKVRSLAYLISQLLGFSLGELSQGANSQGAWLAGAVPHRESGGKVLDQAGCGVRQMWEESLSTYFLHGVEPELDSATPALALKALRSADYVIAMTAYESSELLNYADVLLPIASFVETAGTYQNIEGIWQTFTGVTQPLGQARPGWKIWRVLGNMFGLEDFEYQSQAEVFNAFKANLPSQDKMTLSWGWSTPRHAFNQPISLDRKQHPNHLMLVGYWPIYQVDALVRRAKSLQATPLAAQGGYLSIHPVTGQQLGLAEEDRVIVKQAGLSSHFQLIFDHKVSEGHAIVMGGTKEASGIALLTGFIELIKDHGCA